MQQLASEKKKNKIRNSIIVVSIKKKKKKSKPWLELNNNSILPETPIFPLLSTVHALNCGATDKMITFKSQYH